jgi:hypothetical protein
VSTCASWSSLLRLASGRLLVGAGLRRLPDGPPATRPIGVRFVGLVKGSWGLADIRGVLTSLIVFSSLVAVWGGIVPARRQRDAASAD